jgi:NADH-quinone oxidoreductase subunit J
MTVSFFFYAFAALAVVCAFCVIFARQPARALLALVAVMLSLSGIYLLLGAPFVAMVNLIVYAGAVLVLFLFVIMLQGLGVQDAPLANRFKKYYRVLIFFTGGAFFSVLAFLSFRFGANAPAGINGSAETFGRILFTDYRLPFQLAALLLILGILAGISLAKKEETS